MDPNARWPRLEDSLFAPGDDWESDCVLGRQWDWFIGYGESYKQAADLVVAAVENRSASPDSVAFATFYLYRHYLEITLKGLINIGRQLHDRTSGYPQTHKLPVLWRELRPLLEEANPNGDPKDTDAVEKCIDEFAAIDLSGESARYGEDRTGNPTFDKPVQMNLPNLRDVVGRIAAFFEGSYDWMHELLQYQRDVESDAI